jgi:hypothetical protein
VPLCYFTSNGQIPFPAIAPQSLPQFPNTQYDPTTGQVVPAIPTQAILRNMQNSIGTIGQGVVNQVNSLGNQVSNNLARSAGQSFGNIAAGGMFGVGQGLGGLAAGLHSGAGMRLAGTDTADGSSSSSKGSAGHGAPAGNVVSADLFFKDLGSIPRGDSKSATAGPTASGDMQFASGSSSSGSRGLKQASMFMTNPEITSFGVGAVNAAAGNNFPADLGLSGFSGDFGGGLGGLGGLGGGLSGLGGSLGGLGGGLGGLGGGLGGLAGGLNALGNVQGGLGALNNNPLAAIGNLAGNLAGGAGGLGGGGLGGGLLGGGGLGGGLAGGLGRSPASGVGGLLGALFNNKKGAQTFTSKSASNNVGGFNGQYTSGRLPGSSSSSGGSSISNYNPYGALAGWEQGTLGSSSSSSNALGSGMPAAAAAGGGGSSSGSFQESTINPYASVNYEQSMAQLAQIPGQAIGAMAGYGTGIAQQGHQTIQNAGSNMVQQGITSLQTPGQPVLGGNQQPTVVQGLGQDPNTYLLGGSDYYPGGSNAFGQAGGPAATYTAGQGTLTSGALTPSTTIGGQFAGGQLGSGGGFIGQNSNPGGTFDPSTGERCAVQLNKQLCGTTERSNQLPTNQLCVRAVPQLHLLHGNYTRQLRGSL